WRETSATVRRAPTALSRRSPNRSRRGASYHRARRHAVRTSSPRYLRSSSPAGRSAHTPPAVRPAISLPPLPSADAPRREATAAGSAVHQRLLRAAVHRREIRTVRKPSTTTAERIRGRPKFAQGLCHGPSSSVVAFAHLLLHARVCPDYPRAPRGMRGRLMTLQPYHPPAEVWGPRGIIPLELLRLNRRPVGHAPDAQVPSRSAIPPE